MSAIPNASQLQEIVVNVATQTVQLRQGRRLIASYPASTSKFGLGSEPGSNKTPLGKFQIAQKFGEAALWGTIFLSRQAVGLWSPAFPSDQDLITTRILWLKGLEPENANTFSRYIYFHGTNQEHLLGSAASHGCIRLSNWDIIKLFDAVEVGTFVRIKAK